MALNILFAGSGEFALPCLAALHREHQVVSVFSQLDRPAGRGRSTTPTPVAGFAIAQGLALVRTADLNACALPEADLLVVIAFGQKIAPPVVAHARLGAVNVHASLLPRHRGAAPVNWAIIQGDAVSGNSIIRLASKMDAGAVLAQSQAAIGELETAGELHDRLALDAAPLLLEAIAQLSAGTAVESPQDESKATLAPKLSRAAARIDWSAPAEAVARRIRGMFPWPGCQCRLQGAGPPPLLVTLCRARPVSTTAPAGVLPGTLFDAPASAMPLVACGSSSALELVELQPQGKRPMKLAAFENGNAFDPGMSLEPI